MRFFASFLALALFLSACIPFPHNQQESPTIRGTLVSGGRPVFDVKVQRAVDAPRDVQGCPADSAHTRTDVDGRFYFPSTSYFSPVIMMGDRYDAWRICFEHPDGRKAVWQGGGFWGGPPTQILKCDLDQAKDPKGGLCTAEDKRR